MLTILIVLVAVGLVIKLLGLPEKINTLIIIVASVFVLLFLLQLLGIGHFGLPKLP